MLKWEGETEEGIAMGLSVFAIHCHKEGTRVDKPRNLAQLGCVALWKEKK
jgi:hypothetical protein